MDLPKYYEFVNTCKIISGTKALENIPYELERLGAARPMLLTDKVLLEIGMVKKVLDCFLKGGITVKSLFSDIPTDSSVNLLVKIQKQYIEDECDSIIAVGGGPVIDIAKCLRLVLTQDVLDIKELLGFESLKRGKYIPLIAVPTNGGTGTEATRVAAIADTDNNRRLEIVASEIIPDIALLDPRMTEILPPKVTAAMAMGALCRAIESISCLERNPVSTAFAMSAVGLLIDNIKEAVENGTNRDARHALSNASMLAGVANSNSMGGNIQAIGEALSNVSKIPHGDAITIILPYCMEYNIEYCSKYYAELLLALKGADIYSSTDSKDRASAAIASIRELTGYLNRKCGMPLRLSETRAVKEDLEKVATNAINDCAMAVNPRSMDHQDVMSILERAF